MRPRYLKLLETLADHEVMYVVVGGVAAILEGAPITTLDLDVLVDTSATNLANLHRALRRLEARYRDPAGRTILPTPERLRSWKLHLLLTRQGPLDVLTEVGEGRSYSDLLAETHPRHVEGLEVRVLGLGTLVEIKRQLGRPKDQAMLPLLERTLELKRGGGGD